MGEDLIASAQTLGHPMRRPWLLLTDLGALIKGSRKQELGQPFVRRRGAEKIHTDSPKFVFEIFEENAYGAQLSPPAGVPLHHPRL